VFGETTLEEDGYESLKAFMVSSSVNDCEWIMDFSAKDFFPITYDYSRKLWIYPHRMKNEAFENFKELEASNGEPS